MQILTVENISRTFTAHGRTIKAVDRVSFILEAGDNLAIVGESGSGKTTVARLITGLLKPADGTVTVDASRVQMVFQDPYASFDPLWTIEASLHEAFWRQRLTKEERLLQMKAVLKEVGLEENALARFPHEFSGGQRQRLAIARALLAEPALLILDEATAALDTLIARQILDLLKGLKQKFNLTYIFISHNLRLVKNFSDKMIIMKDGSIVEEGPVAQLFQAPRHPYTRQLMKAAFAYQ